jgi:single-strand DNA-binding protein
MSATIYINGNLVADPEVTFAKSGKAIAKFRVASNRRAQQPDGTWQTVETNYWRCTAFAHLAEKITDRLKKGDPVIVRGRPTINTWETPEGEKRERLEVIAESVGMDLKYRSERTEGSLDGPDDVWNKTDQNTEPPF